MLTGVALARRTGDLLNGDVLPIPIRYSALNRKLVFVRCSTVQRQRSRTGGSRVPAAACCT